MKKLTIKKDELKKWNDLLKLDEVDFEGLDIPEDTTLFCKTVEFDDGAFADLKVCSGQTNLWCEMVWFDKNGCEISCSDACADTLEGEWYFPQDDGGRYDVEVVGA